MDSTETLINLCLLSGAGLGFIAVSVFLQCMSGKTRRRIMSALTMSGWACFLIHGEGGLDDE